MNIHREPLDILFAQVKPEDLYRDIEKRHQLNGCHFFPTTLSAAESTVDTTLFFLRAPAMRRHYSPDEIEYICERTMAKIRDEAESLCQRPSLFHLLTHFTRRGVLCLEHGEPLCDKAHVLRWRSIAFRIGEDLLTSAHLAAEDLYYGRTRTFFGWPQNIGTNNPTVREVVRHGIAENHMHLNASFPSFHLSWICLMNHPQEIRSFVVEGKAKEQFRFDLSPRLQYSDSDIRWSWEKRVELACWLRASLFHLIVSPENAADGADTGDNTKNGENPKEEFSFKALLNFMSEAHPIRYSLPRLVDHLRFAFGQQVSMSNGRQVCLDYAISKTAENGFYRALQGERWLLYQCFRRCFGEISPENGILSFTAEQQDLFYLYLLLKNSLRSELIQINQEVGFQNFLSYQDRKFTLWEKYQEYWAEGYRMTINGTMDLRHQNSRSYINSLEARFGPGKTPEKTRNLIEEVDREVLFVQREIGRQPPLPAGHRLSVQEHHNQAKELDCFYVLHFSKKAMPRTCQSFCGIVAPRNDNVRKGCRTQAFALARALSDSPYLCTRIRGIDASSVEIGCRPETFATEFRFLRRFVPRPSSRRRNSPDKDIFPLLRISYHAGEDFLDVVDGLRAIDEAILFLNLSRGDRLGHALALGVSPEQHYTLKRNSIVTTKQNRLDDIVWMLFRAQELNLTLPSGLCSVLECEARALMQEVYQELCQQIPSITLQDYYISWKLRGDHPHLYHSPTAQSASPSDSFTWRSRPYYGNSTLEGQYDNCMENHAIGVGSNGYQPSRRHSTLYALLHDYHYSEAVRSRGQVEVDCTVGEDYIAAVRRLQDGMIQAIADRGISIECNPSSNVLIGTFSRYEEHPLFRFNHYGLSPVRQDEPDPLCVSLNTDDPGVFDTSLENEYALVAAALEGQRTENGRRLYSDDVIRGYLHHLREMGNMQVFPRSFRSSDYHERTPTNDTY